MRTKGGIRSSLLLSVIVLVIFVSVYFILRGDGQYGAAVNTDGWKSYINEHYAFSLHYPPEWKLTESVADPDAPAYRIYKPHEDDHGVTETEDELYPAIVSVFPLSSPTRNLSGSIRSSSVVFAENVKKAYDNLLADGTRWATVAYFENIPSTWSDSGFVLSRVRVNDPETECFRNGIRVIDEPCLPLSGDRYVKKGHVDKRDMLIVDAVLGSFRFIDKEIKESSYKDLVRIEVPPPGGEVSSPLYIAGKARGHWYFAAAFPVMLIDADGEVIVEAEARAVDKWMTTDYVSFEAVMIFDESAPAGGLGSLILEKATVSGTDKDHHRFGIPVRLSGEKTNGQDSSRCIVTGCSGQICSDEEVFTTCEYLPEYDCYRSALCERQADGKCGWTMSDELVSCLERKSASARK